MLFVQKIKLFRYMFNEYNLVLDLLTDQMSITLIIFTIGV